MITKNPLEGAISLDELFPSASEMTHGNAELVKKVFTIIFCAMDLARSTIGRRGVPEVWASAFLASVFGVRHDGEDAEGIRQVSRDLETVVGTPKDIRLYSVFRRIEAAQGLSEDPEGFKGRVGASLRMLVSSEREQADLFTSEVWGCVRDAFAIYERLTGGEEGAKVPLLHPAAGGLSVRIRDFVVKLFTSEFHQGQDEQWPAYIQRMWAGAVDETFPYLGLAGTIPDSAHEEVQGEDLRDLRVHRAHHDQFRYPDGFDPAILREVGKPFMRCALFGGDTRRYRDLVMQQDFDYGAYAKQRKQLQKAIRYAVPTTAMPRSAFDRILEDGEFKSFWQLPEAEQDDTFCDSPADARALNDMRLFGEKSCQVVYSILVMDIEEDKMVEQNVNHIARSFGRQDPVTVQFTGHVKNQATISWGDSFQNFIVLPYSLDTLTWLLEARFFMGALRAHPMAQQIMPGLPDENSLWLSFLQMMSGQKSPYIELQIHGRVGLDWIRRADQSVPEGEPLSLESELKAAKNNAN